MKRILNDTIAFFAITLIAGLLLGGVYTITKEPIKDAQERAKQEAYKSVFKEATQFEITEIEQKQAEKILSEHGYKDNIIDEVVCAKGANGELLGYVITVISTAGYGGNIQFSMGITVDGALNGYSILSISETAGLGMKATEEKFSSQFENKQVTKFEVTKNGASSDQEIDAISGATITSKAITNGINAGLCFFQCNYLEEEMTNE